MRIPKLTFRKVIDPGEMRPPFYGLAWWQDFNNQAVCYPIPFNWIIGWLREIAWYLARGPHGFKNQELKILLRNEFNKGYDLGYQDGLHGIKSYYHK